VLHSRWLGGEWSHRSVDANMFPDHVTVKNVGNSRLGQQGRRPQVYILIIVGNYGRSSETAAEQARRHVSFL
jgi:hypothetical protein